MGKGRERMKNSHNSLFCYFAISSKIQSLPEEEQQRVLGEEKMLGVNKKGATSPASKKTSPDASKVSDAYRLGQQAGCVVGMDTFFTFRAVEQIYF